MHKCSSHLSNKDLERPWFKRHCPGSWYAQLPGDGRLQLSGRTSKRLLPDTEVPVHTNTGTSEWRSWRLYYSLSHWQLMKVAQHWISISECQWWTMTLHSRHFAIESTVAVVKLTSHERLCQHLGSVCGQRASDSPHFLQLEEAQAAHCCHIILHGELTVEMNSEIGHCGWKWAWRTTAETPWCRRWQAVDAI